MFAGLSLSGGGRGFSPVAMNVAPGYFHGKTEEKWDQKKSLAVIFPAYLSHLPSNLKLNLSNIPGLSSPNACLGLFTIYTDIPFGSRFGQVVSKIQC